MPRGNRPCRSPLKSDPASLSDDFYTSFKQNILSREFMVVNDDSKV
jgi:hypothetical protein